MGLKLNGTTQSQLKVLASIGINISKKNLKTAIFRIEEFTRQKVLISLDGVTFADSIDRNKNQKIIDTLFNIYENKECCEIRECFLTNNKDEIVSILCDLENMSFDKKKLFDIIICQTFINIYESFNLFEKEEEFINIVCKTLNNDENMYDLKTLFGLLKTFNKTILNLGYLYSLSNFNDKAQTVILKEQTKEALVKEIFSEQEIFYYLNLFFERLKFLLNEEYDSFTGVNGYGIKNGVKVYYYFSPNKELYRPYLNELLEKMFQLFKEHLLNIFHKKSL